MYDKETMNGICEHLMRTLKDVKKKIDSGNGLINPEMAMYIKTLGSALKSFKIVEAMEEEKEGQSYRGGTYDGGSMRGGGSYRSYDDMDYGMGGSGRRDSMGRFSRDDGYSRAADEMMEHLRMARDMADGPMRQELDRLMR